MENVTRPAYGYKELKQSDHNALCSIDFLHTICIVKGCHYSDHYAVHLFLCSIQNMNGFMVTSTTAANEICWTNLFKILNIYTVL